MLHRSNSAPNDLPEQDFLYNALTLLAHTTSDYLSNVYQNSLLDLYNNPHSREEYIIQIIEQYKHEQLSRQVATAMKTDLLRDTARDIGLDDGHEEPYEVYVLSLGSATSLHDMEMYGTAAVQSALLHDKDTRKWADDLMVRNRQFQNRTGSPSLGIAWTTNILGRTLLCLPMSCAEILLDSFEEPESTMYSKDAHQNALQALKHEYVHTQQSLLIGDTGDVGLTAEEARAIAISHDFSHYKAIRYFGNDLYTLTGRNLVSYLSSNRGEDGKLSVYASIAQHLGLERKLEVMMVRPSNYTKYTDSVCNTAVDTYLGSYDGILSRILKDYESRGWTAEIDRRVDEFANSIIHDHRGGSLKHLMVRRSYGLNVVTELIEKRIAGRK